MFSKRFFWVFTWFYSVLPDFTGFHCALVGFLGFTWFELGSTRFYLILLGFYWVLPSITGFHWVQLSFNWVLLFFFRFWTGFYGLVTQFSWILPFLTCLGSTQLKWAAVAFAKSLICFQRVQLGFWFGLGVVYWVLLGFPGFSWALTQF